MRILRVIGALIRATWSVVEMVLLIGLVQWYLASKDAKAAEAARIAQVTQNFRDMVERIDKARERSDGS